MSTPFLTWLEKSMYAYGQETLGSGYRYKWAHLARDLGLRRATISHWIKAGAIPDADTISKLAVHFGTTSAEIYKTIGQPLPPGTEYLALREQFLSIFNKLDPRRQQKMLKEANAEYDAPSKK